MQVVSLEKSCFCDTAEPVILLEASIFLRLYIIK